MTGQLWTLRAWWGQRRALRAFNRVRARQRVLAAPVVDACMDEAFSAACRQDWRFAAGSWERAIAADASLAKSSKHTALVLSLLGRFDEAEAIMAEGVAREPNNPIFSEGRAIIAERRNDIPEAILRWAATRARFPRETMAYSSGASCLLLAGRPEEAEQVAHAGLNAFADDIGIRVQHALAAEARHDWQAALDRWELVRDRYRHPFGILGAVRSLARLGRMDEAEAVLAQGRYFNPTEPSIAVEAARHAQANNDLPEALRRWADVRRRFPELPNGYVEGIQALAITGNIAAIATVRAEAAEHLPSLDVPMPNLPGLALADPVPP